MLSLDTLLTGKPIYHLLRHYCIHSMHLTHMPKPSHSHQLSLLHQLSLSLQLSHLHQLSLSHQLSLLHQPSHLHQPSRSHQPSPTLPRLHSGLLKLIILLVSLHTPQLTDSRQPILNTDRPSPIILLNLSSHLFPVQQLSLPCLLYTSDAADE